MSDLPQLQMRHPLGELSPSRSLPEGFRLRNARPDDAEGLARVLSAAFETPWTPVSARAELLDHPQVPTTYLVERGGEVVATASYQLKDETPAAGWVHWVGVHPGARGLGLGEALVHAVLARSALAGHAHVLLTTDDFRLPAIRTYLRLGFAPDPWHPSHPARWARALAETNA